MPNAVEEPVRTLGAPELVASAEGARSVVALPMSIDEDLLIEPTRVGDYGIDAATEVERDRHTGS
jgi:hypothetical protein